MTETSRLRVSIIGVVVIALFSTLFVRLWFLQVAAGKTYAAAVHTNTIRQVPVDPLRGRILDATGKVLADNKIVDAITMDRNTTPAREKRFLATLAPLLGTTPAALKKSVDDPKVSPLKPAVIARGISPDVAIYVSEHRDQLPGVRATQLSERVYPYGMAGAHVLGWVGEIGPDELAARKGEGYRAGDTVGKSGVEASYETVLHGKPGHEDIEVDAAGKPGKVVREVAPAPGKDLVLTIDIDTEGATEAALEQAMVSVRSLQDDSYKEGFRQFAAPTGAVVVMDADTGAVVAMASNPGYDPNELAAGVTQARLDQLAPKDQQQPQPLQNKVISSTYATGSTFKLFTAMSALESGIRTPNSTIDDKGFVHIGNLDFSNSGRARNGRVNLARALTVSSDVYFYEIGGQFWDEYKAALPKGAPADSVTAGLQLQATAHQFGFGAKTGIRLPNEVTGRVPDPAFRVSFNKDNPDESSRIWYPGDNVLFAVGQGDFAATPLQLANGYATYANGGTRFVPRVASGAFDPMGKDTVAFNPETVDTVAIDPNWRAAIDQGLHGVVADPKGTAYAAFQGFPLDAIPLEAKTGTAQVNGRSDSSVFAAMATVNGKHYVIVSIVEQAGFGASVSAPIVRRVLEHLAGIPTLGPVQAIPMKSSAGMR